MLVLMLSEFCIPQLLISNNKQDGVARLGLTTRRPDYCSQWGCNGAAPVVAVEANFA